MQQKQTYYAVYQGDTFIDLGTIQELSERLGVKCDTLKFMTYPSYQKRLEKRIKNYSKGHMIVIKIEEDLEYEKDFDI